MGWRKGLRTVLILGTVLWLAGCQSAYYGALEQVGIHKRDILVDRVKEARDAQEETKEQFQSALERYSAVVNFDGGELESRYIELNDAFEDSEARAKDVSDRVDSVEDVAEALFEEWREELELYQSADLKRSSAAQLRDTERRYGKLIRAMRRAESKIAPVLSAFRDQVLYLKHNLNARAVAALKGELDTIETDTAALIREMEAAIRESNTFIAELES